MTLYQVNYLKIIAFLVSSGFPSGRTWRFWQFLCYRDFRCLPFYNSGGKILQDFPLPPGISLSFLVKRVFLKSSKQSINSHTNHYSLNYLSLPLFLLHTGWQDTCRFKLQQFALSLYLMLILTVLTVWLRCCWLGKHQVGYPWFGYDLILNVGVSLYS